MKIKLITIDSVEKFCNLAAEFNGEVYIRQGKLCVSAKSIMGIFSLNLLMDMELEFEDGSAKDISQFLNNIQDLGIIKM